MGWVTKKKRPKPYRGCKMPGLWTRMDVVSGSVWACPRCSKLWILKDDSFIDEMYFTQNDRNEEGCEIRD